MMYNRRSRRHFAAGQQEADVLRKLNITCKQTLCRKSPHSYAIVKMVEERNYGIWLMHYEVCVREWRIGENRILCYFEEIVEYPIELHEREKLEKWMKIKNLT